MLYDLARQPPEPGSLLESLFLLISIRRRETELFKTEAVVAAVAGAAAGQYDAIDKSLQAFKNSMFPFLEAEKARRKEDEKKVLDNWIAQKALAVRPLWMSHRHSKRLHSRLRKQAERTRRGEEMRRKTLHTRI